MKAENTETHAKAKELYETYNIGFLRLAKAVNASAYLVSKWAKQGKWQKGTQPLKPQRRQPRKSQASWAEILEKYGVTQEIFARAFRAALKKHREDNPLLIKYIENLKAKAKQKDKQ